MFFLSKTDIGVEIERGERIKIKRLCRRPVDPDDIEIEAALGKHAPRKFKLTVTAPGKDPQVFADLAMPGQDFHELQWLGFSSTSAEDSVFYLDNLRIKRVP